MNARPVSAPARRLPSATRGRYPGVHRPWHPWLVLWMALLLLLIWPLPAHAQDVILPPPFPPPPAPPPPVPMIPTVGVDRYQVDVQIDGRIASVHLSQVFRNQGNQPVEGTYLFPLPPDAAVGGFQMRVDGQVIEGELLPADQARRIYQDVVRRYQDPALLQYLGRGLFQANLFPIPPGESRTVELRYTQLIGQQNGLAYFRFPLATPQHRDGRLGALEIRVDLVNQPGLRILYSPSHPIDVSRPADDQARVTFSQQDVRPESDFELYFSTAEDAVGLNLLSYRPAGEDGYFVLLAAPAIQAAAPELVRRDLVLVLDVSGSMEGGKLEQARAAAHFIVDHLNPGDRFNLISFSTGVRLWQPGLQPVADETRQGAHAWIDGLQAGGSTDINRALLEALAQIQPEPEAEGRPAYILFLTDGLPTQGETDAWRIVDNAIRHAPAHRSVRLFTFGVGYDVNTDLLDTVSSRLQGRSSYVRPDQRIDEAVSQFYAGISAPVLADLALDFGEGVATYDLFPYPLPDLFAGEQLVVAGRYQQSGTITVTLQGQVNGVTQIYPFPDQTLVSAGGEPFVARLWATRKIGALLEAIRRNGASQEAIDAIVTLSLRYGIVTPYTSYLVQEPSSVAAAPRPLVPGGQGGAGPVPLPADAMPRAYGPVAQASVAAEAEAVAALPAAGEAAVVASQARSQIAEATVVPEHEAVRFVNGKTFGRQGQVPGPDGEGLILWVDTAYEESMAVETVIFGSPRYFQLAEDPDMAQWLAISPELVVVVDAGHAIRITTRIEQ
ncbi:VWA domain-containing protein [Litorilinea aerophila]|uniref:VWA domain-containing protein n=1 Tax=Litorilinea aerophila TaxID=1204385 RepID=A0A540VKD7_9CHLR|nr:VIT domain-containing protein [Litorilinea aerophila]MCC9075324.1 VWA domain-containing protein [Litorilinea aerophila]